MADTSIFVHETGETASDSGDGFEFTLYGSGIQGPEDGWPDPAVYVDGVLKTSGYTIDAEEGTITFETSQAGSTVTCDYTWEVPSAGIEDTSVYGFTAALNVRVEDDVNGLVQIVESANRVKSFAGTLQWPYIGTGVLNTVLHLAQAPGVTFDLHRESLPEGSPYKEITGLVVVGAPRGEEIPGAPGRYTVSIEVRQVNS